MSKAASAEDAMATFLGSAIWTTSGAMLGDLPALAGDTNMADSAAG